MKRLISLSLFAGAAAVAMALSSYSAVFKTTYSIKPTSTLGANACKVCHMSNKPAKEKGLNKYGEDVKAAMKAAKSRKMTAAILHSLDKKKSAGGSKTNIQLIKADKFPGGNS